MRGLHVLAAGFTSLNLAIVATFAPGGPETILQGTAVLIPVVALLFDEGVVVDEDEDDVEDVDEVVG